MARFLPFSRNPAEQLTKRQILLRFPVFQDIAFPLHLQR